MKRKNVSKVFLFAAMAICLMAAGLLSSRKAQAQTYVKYGFEPKSITWVCNGKNNVNAVMFCGYTKDGRKYKLKPRFYSLDTRILQISKDGNVGVNDKLRGAKKSGSTKLCATYNGRNYYCNVKKVNPKINKKSISLCLGGKESFKLKMSDIKDVNGKNLKCTWTSSKPDCIEVNPKTGAVKAKKECENETITCDVDGKRKYTCKVSVSKNKVSQITLSESTMTLSKNESRMLTAAVEPANAYNKEVAWTSDNNTVATVDENGFVTAHNAGTATITAVAEDDASIKASCVVTVPMSGNEVTLSSSDLTITEGTKSLSINDTTGQITADKVAWTVSDSKIISIKNTSGLQNEVTGLANGTARVYAKVTFADGTQKTLECLVTVTLMNREISAVLSAKNPSSSANSLSQDGIVYLTITNNTSKAIAMMRYDMDIFLTIGKTEYSMSYMDGNGNDENFLYESSGQVSCIERGNKRTYALIASNSEQTEELRKQAKEFKTGILKFYYYDEDGKQHLIKVAANGSETETLSSVTGEIINSSEVRSWRNN